MKTLTTLRFLFLVVSIALIAFGVWLVLNPTKTMLMLAYIAAFIILAMSVGSLVYFLRTHRSPLVLVEMIVSLALALILLFSDEIAEDFVPIMLALWLVFRGILWIAGSIRFGVFGSSVGVVCLILGIVFLIFPSILAALVSFGLGIFVLISGCVGLFMFKNFRIY